MILENQRPNRPGPAKTGQSGAGGAPGVTVPLEALQEQGGDQVVFIQESPGVYHRRVVRLGPALGDQVVIEAGVKAGEQVVTQGAYRLLAKVRQ